TGQKKDCTFAPVPDQCHVAVCDPKTGTCEPVPGNEGKDCTDKNDLCSVGNKCAAGACTGGKPKDCSQLTKGCFNGVCDKQNGNCKQEPVPPGGKCDEAANQCNAGKCDNNGKCLPVPANENGPCSTDPCFVGQSCKQGVCQGGTEIKICKNGDKCCPLGCDSNTDNDCFISATCQDLLTSQNVWGKTAKGVDLRAWTASTLHYIGCPGDGCDASQFFCKYDENAETLEFGSLNNVVVRAMVDPNNAQGDLMPNSYGGCCQKNQILGLCNAPDANNNGVPVDHAKALCSALGYKDGKLVGWQNDNSCPEVHAVTADGLSWDTDWVDSQGYGYSWKCTGFK
ncbi:MAG: hypothetical protein HY744_33020, partial [Deltaproteobacteria bacterium]|nr:hypothetical protein [Deltaproteobacteria bacterium]